ncbi:MAG: energy transducer TonB [Sandaracinaceae bacterium]|nr:energy transducer TonB [Sandaracinaceae bacterium]
MASESTPPPAASGGGNLKYAIIGVVLLAAAVGLWLAMQNCSGETTTVQAPVTDAGIIERPTSIADDDLVLPDLEPDAGPEPDAGGPRIRYVTRYVGGGGGSFNCSGNLDQARAAAIVAEHNLQFRNCYERRLKVNNQLEGRVSVTMRVARSGEVDAVQVGGSLGDPEVFSCIRTVARRIRFATPQGGSCAVVSVPFNFTPQR